MKEILEKEILYQILSVVLALELLTLAALSPRTSGLEPLGFHAIGSLRLIGLLLLGAFLYEAAPRLGLSTLFLWAVILSPPELWAFSLEAREGFPPSLISSFVAGCGSYTFARIFPSASQIFPVLGVTALFFNGFQPSVYSLPLLLLLGSSMLGLLLVLFQPQGVRS